MSVGAHAQKYEIKSRKVRAEELGKFSSVATGCLI
jgi:hypothetical protein